LLRKANKDIATPLGIRARTVDAHLRSIFGELGYAVSPASRLAHECAISY
jgi:DNA-binding NarL/FixJ family response regulator